MLQEKQESPRKPQVKRKPLVETEGSEERGRSHTHRLGIFMSQNIMDVMLFSSPSHPRQGRVLHPTLEGKKPEPRGPMGFWRVGRDLLPPPFWEGGPYPGPTLARHQQGAGPRSPFICPFPSCDSLLPGCWEPESQ